MYDLYIECADPTGCGKDNDAKSWDFQACYQIALAYGSTNVTDMFPNLPWTEKMKRDYCMKTWQVEPSGDEVSCESTHLSDLKNLDFNGCGRPTD